jgi:WD40 repeat protein
MIPRISYASGPVFTITSLGETTASTSELPCHRIIYAGGGGSSKSGVGNAIIAADLSYVGLAELCKLDTGLELCSFVCVSRRKSMLVAVFGSRFRLCKLNGLRRGSQRQKQIIVAAENHRSDFNDSINSCTINCESSLLATGGDDGVLRIWALSGDENDRLKCTLTKICMPGHEAPITDCSFSEAGHLVVTASKDGTCRVWSLGGNGTTVCVVSAQNAVPLCKFRGKLIVRACKFIGNDSLVSIQSGSRGSAFVSKWSLATSRDTNSTVNVTIAAKRQISRHPVSAVSLGDGSVAYGDVEGVIGFSSINDLAPLGPKVQVHELPVTALAMASTNAMSGALPCALSVSADYRVVVTPFEPAGTFSMRNASICVAIVVALMGALVPVTPSWSCWIHFV